jgi:tellurite resistance-related uncharacterized protein
MDSHLPEGLKAYKKTPLFDESTIPVGLQKDHSTKDGVWALIHVLEGRLLYRIQDPPSEQELDSSRPGVVCPGQPHQVKPMGPVSFYVEFYSLDEDAGMPHAKGGFAD